MDRPILFSGAMVKALLDGKKTQTRRVLADGTTGEGPTQSPKFFVGDRLWVREAWRTHVGSDDVAPRDISPELLVQYEASGPSFGDGLSGKVRPGMFMPRWASRLTLMVTEVRVQRLQDISVDDAKAEGVDLIESRFHTRTARFKDLWNRLNDDRGFGWSTNPWVVAVSFTVERRNIDQVAP